MEIIIIIYWIVFIKELELWKYVGKRSSELKTENEENILCARCVVGLNGSRGSFVEQLQYNKRENTNDKVLCL